MYLIYYHPEDTQPDVVCQRHFEMYREAYAKRLIQDAPKGSVCHECAGENDGPDEAPEPTTAPGYRGCGHPTWMECYCNDDGDGFTPASHDLTAPPPTKELTTMTASSVTSVTPQGVTITDPTPPVVDLRGPVPVVVSPTPRGSVFASMYTIPTKAGRPTYKLFTRLADGSIARLQCAVCQRKFKTLSAKRIYCTTRCAATMRPPVVDTDTTTWF